VPRWTEGGPSYILTVTTFLHMPPTAKNTQACDAPARTTATTSSGFFTPLCGSCQRVLRNNFLHSGNAGHTTTITTSCRSLAFSLGCRSYGRFALAIEAFDRMF